MPHLELNYIGFPKETMAFDSHPCVSHLGFPDGIQYAVIREYGSKIMLNHNIRPLMVHDLGYIPSLSGTGP